jgi:hypothetical protein
MIGNRFAADLNAGRVLAAFPRGGVTIWSQFTQAGVIEAIFLHIGPWKVFLHTGHFASFDVSMAR